ncbi:MAG: hypothetical protein ACR2II_09670 [Chthoniobacterales bacterium]
MNSSFIGSRCTTRLVQTGLTLALGLGLASGLWVATMPVATAKLMSASEMIQAGLPSGVMVATAGKPQFLTAVCAAVKTHRDSAAAITKAAVSDHHEYAGEIVTTALRCVRGEKVDCDLTGAIVAAAIVGWPQAAAQIDDAAIAAAPECSDAVQTHTENTRNDGKQVMDGKEMFDGKRPLGDTPEEVAVFGPPNTPPFFFGGGGGFNPAEPLIQVCDNGRMVTIREGRLTHYLNNHPGSFVGMCQITPSTSR